MTDTSVQCLCVCATSAIVSVLPRVSLRRQGLETLFPLENVATA